jgi:hypothetical protein
MIQIEQDFIFVSLSDQQAKKLNATWNQKRKTWRVPNTLGALRELHALGYDVLAYGTQKAQAREHLLGVKNLKEAPGEEKLRPYQRVDVNFLHFLPHAAIFNEQRTGK